MTLPKDHNNLPIANPIVMEIYNLSNKEFTIALSRKISEVQENTDNLMKSEKTTQKQNEKFSKEKS